MSRKVQRKQIARGKTKTIWSVPGTDNEVDIESRDDITAGDGARRSIIVGKGIFSTETTCNCFRLLEKMGVPTHFIERVDRRTFRAHRVNMIPVELVARRIATGSCLKRNPEFKEGDIFKELVIEFYLKDDARHDPLMIWIGGKGCFELHDAKKLIGEGYIEDLSPGTIPLVPESLTEVKWLHEILGKTFQVLEEAWAQQNVALVDFKIECGYTAADGLLAVADVIDNDSWRIWPGRDKAQMRDKQVFRDLKEVTPKALKGVGQNYAWVAAATAKFVDW